MSLLFSDEGLATTEPPTMSFAIETEVTSAYYEELLNYTYQKYLQPQSESYANVKRDVVDGVPVLNFTFMDHEAKWNVDVQIKTGKPIQI
jgi:hypothetical protein